MDAAELWEIVRTEMMKQISKASFDIWLEPAIVVGLKERNLFVKVESSFHQ